MIEIRIDNLTFYAIIGILEYERHTPQKLVVDAAFTLAEGNFLDYAQAKEIIKKTIQTNNYELLEDALQELSDLLYQRFPFIQTLTITIKKPQVLPDCIPSVTIKRTFI